MDQDRDPAYSTAHEAYMRKLQQIQDYQIYVNNYPSIILQSGICENIKYNMQYD